MADYEEEQRRLLALWEECESEDEIVDTSDECEDLLHESPHNTESEQEYDSTILVTDEDSVAVTENDGQPVLQCPSDESLKQVTSFDQKRNRSSQQCYLGRDKKTKWKKTCPNTSVKTRAENIIKIHLPAVKPLANDSKTPKECFNLFIDETMITSIVTYTNQRLEKKRVVYDDKHSYIVKPTDSTEIRAVLGLLYLSGVYKTNRLNLDDLWKTNGLGIEIFRRMMSLQRFRILLTCLRFDNMDNRELRKQTDKFAAIRAVFSKFVENCQTSYTPSEYLTIDEQLPAFRGRCPFRVYMPNKPSKYGLKLFALVDARTYYVLNVEPYVGEQPEGPYKQRNSAFDVVDRLVGPVSGTNRNVTFDNWFTSFPLMNHLLHRHKLTSVGTVPKNKKELPPSLLIARNREVHSTMFAFQEKTKVASYVPKKGKIVLVASTLHHDDKISPKPQKKTEIIEFYNFTKGGVDVVDELCGRYDVSRSCKRWPLTIFFFVMNISAINARIIYQNNTNDTKMKRRIFLEELGLSLVQEHISARKNNMRLSVELRIGIEKCLGEANENVDSNPKRQKRIGRCGVCPRNKDRKCQKQCAQCQTFLCLEHAISLCENCFKSRPS